MFKSHKVSYPTHRCYLDSKAHQHKQQSYVMLIPQLLLSVWTQHSQVYIIDYFLILYVFNASESSWKDPIVLPGLASFSSHQSSLLTFRRSATKMELATKLFKHFLKQVKLTYSLWGYSIACCHLTTWFGHSSSCTLSAATSATSSQ